jgi:hypothetical protein
LKWHLAGVVSVDSRGFLETLIDGYRTAGLSALHARWENLKLQFGGNWMQLCQPDLTEGWSSLRRGEFYFTCRAFAWWLLALILMPVVRLLKPSSGWSFHLAKARHAAAWLIIGWIIWIALMFVPGSAMLHQGTLVTQLVGFTLIALICNRAVFMTATILQIVWLAVAWVPPSNWVQGSFSPYLALAAAGSAVALASVALGAKENFDSQ